MALCTGPDVHPDPSRRYVACMADGVFYLVGALFAGTVLLASNAFPPAYIESSVITFLVTASGMTIGGLGAAFWGIVIGMVAHWVLCSR